MANKSRPALGAGLGVLFGDDDSEFSSAGELSSLPIGKVEPRREQPRECFDEEALRALADSIAQHGLIQPIVVRKLETGFYQIIAGERRWRASRMAGLEEIPVRILNASDRVTAELALVENLQREDLNPIEEAKGYKVLIEEYGLTQEEAAKSVGRSRPAITNTLRLLSLSPEVLSLVESRDLSAGHGRALASVEDAALQLKLAQESIQNGYSVRELETLVGKFSSGKPTKKVPTKSTLVDYQKEVSDDLTRILGTKVRLIDKNDSGRIEISYSGAEAREALIQLLKNIK